MKILEVNPGIENSALVYFDYGEERILQTPILPNPEALTLFRSLPSDCEAVVIEMIAHLWYRDAGWQGRVQYLRFHWRVERDLFLPIHGPRD